MSHRQLTLRIAIPEESIVPALIDQPNVLRVRTLWLVGADQDVSSVMHFTWTGTAPDDAACTALATSIHAAAVTNMVPKLGSENQLHGIEVTDLTSASAGSGEHLANVVGTEGGSDLGAAVAVLMRIHIGRRYRGGKPRVYWPLGTANDLDTPNAWLAGSVTAFNTACAQYINDIQALSSGGCNVGVLCNVSYYEGFNTVGPDLQGRFKYPPKPRTVAIPPDVFLGISINPRPASQRRRNLQSA
jgi:hypothetical protein